MKRILVGLDASPRAPEVVETASRLARALGGHVVLYRAVGIPTDIPREAYALAPEGVTQLLVSQAKAYLDECLPMLSGLSVSTRVDVGTSWRSICAAAHEEGADLIVIGSHGFGGLDRVMGTTAAKVVNHAECSVLVVRDSHKAAAAAAPES
jgi:nucleotide-binding universal stress UspA family protein